MENPRRNDGTIVLGFTYHVLFVAWLWHAAWCKAESIMAGTKNERHTESAGGPSLTSGAATPGGRRHRRIF